MAELESADARDGAAEARRVEAEPARVGHRRSLAPLLLGLLAGVIVALLGVLFVGGPLIVAHRRDMPLERIYGRFAVSLASRAHAGSAANPSSSNARAIEAGRAAYTGSCAQCHGATGDGKGVFGQATYPPATDLTTSDAKGKSDAELFWIIKNGLSFTGMPAFAQQYKDTDIWSLVSYLRALQQGQANAFQIPTPTTDQLAQADPHGNATQRGAAVYFAMGCQTCHGATGNAPGELGLREGGREAERAVRSGRTGMPGYTTGQISDAQLQDLEAYLATFGGSERPRRGSLPESGPAASTSLTRQPSSDW